MGESVETGDATRPAAPRFAGGHLGRARPAPGAIGSEVCRADGIVMSFGAVSVLEDVSLSVNAGEILGVVGPNGSGKTTLLNVLSGFLRPKNGTIAWAGNTRGRSPQRLARMGMGRTFQQPRLIDELTAVQHVRIALDWQQRRGVGQRAREILVGVQFDLALADTPVWRLSYGAKRLVDLARAIASAQSILLLDEPTAGVGREEWEPVVAAVRQLASDGVAVIVTDHNMPFMRKLCDRATFLHHGRVLAVGPIDDVLAEPHVIEAYVGKQQARAMDRPAAPDNRRDCGSDDVARSAGELRVSELCAGYRGNQVVHEVDLHVRPGQLVGIVGPNGAGKSTLLRAVSGTVATMSGSVALGDRQLSGQSPSQRVKRGLATVSEGRRIFPALTVEENLQVGFHGRRSGVDRAVEDALAVFPHLRSLLKLRAASLSGGQQQMLVIARALVGGPRMLLLDEPTLGLAPVLIEALLDSISQIAANGVGVLITDQDAQRLAVLCDTCHVLALGRVVMVGAGHEIEARLEQVEGAYLGSAEAPLQVTPMEHTGRGRADRAVPTKETER